MMNKISILLIVVALAGGAALVLVKNNTFFDQKVDQKEMIATNHDLMPIELTPEERRALEDAGLTMPDEEDPILKNLQSVRSSDDIGAIEADIQETDLSQLDAESAALKDDLDHL